MRRRLKPAVSVWVGIDPGKQGWIVAYNGSTISGAWPLPYLEDELDLVVLERLLLRLRLHGGVALVVLEQQQVFGKEGAVGAFTTGFNYGVLKAALRYARLPFAVVTPETWKRGVGVPISEKKLPPLPKKPKGATKAALAKWERAVATAEKVRARARRERKKDTKAIAVRRAQELAPGYDFRKSANAKVPHPDKAEAFLMAVYGFRIHERS